MSDAVAAFELPAMPGSYEDFDFNLDLPDNITASDLNLVSSPEFSQLFAPSSQALSPYHSLTSASHDLHAPGTSSLSSMGMNWTKSSAPTTPKNAREDLEMTPSSGQRIGSIEAPHDSALGLGGMEPHTTSAPTNMGLGGRISPTTGALFSFDDMTSAAKQNKAMNAPPKGLFDDTETSFLSNFLSNFDGWDFNPNLPMQMPSFAEAEKNALQYGIPKMPDLTHADPRRNSRRTLSSHRNKNSPNTAQYAAGGSPANRLESSAGAAFGLPIERWNENEGDGAMDPSSSSGKKIKTEHGANVSTPSKMQYPTPRHEQMDFGGGVQVEKKHNHILSEQRRRGHIREAFKELVDLLEAGREFGARGLGLSSGAGTGIEDEGLDDRSDYESTLEDEEPNAANKRRKTKNKRRLALEEARKAGQFSASRSSAGGGRGKGRGRGGSAGGGAGSKSAVLFQAVDLLHWLEGRNQGLLQHVQELENSIIHPAA